MPLAWCPESDLNQRPTAYEAVALPLSYRGYLTAGNEFLVRFLPRYNRAAKRLCSIKRPSTLSAQVCPFGDERRAKLRRTDRSWRKE